MDNSEKITQQPTPTQPLPKSQPVNVPAINRKFSLPVIIGVLLIIVIVGIGSYLLGTRKSQTIGQAAPAQSSPSTVTPSGNLLPTTIPSQTPDVNALGTSKISFVDSGNEIYLQHEINLIDSKVEFPNDKARTKTKVYSQDESLEPKELTGINTTNYKWTDIVSESILDSIGSKSISIADRLFSFKKIPNTNSFVFVVEWDRSAGQNQGSWSPYQLERVLFYYDRSQGIGKLNKIQSFSNYPSNTKSYTFPKIDTFNQNNRYVSLELFGCWNCGGHKPETLLLDLKTLKTKNIGKVELFSWGQDGAYQYKDYVVIECKELQPGECAQDPSTLPLKTGQL